jgi:hypothetical protein
VCLAVVTCNDAYLVALHCDGQCHPEVGGDSGFDRSYRGVQSFFQVDVGVIGGAAEGGECSTRRLGDDHVYAPASRPSSRPSARSGYRKSL